MNPTSHPATASAETVLSAESAPKKVMFDGDWDTAISDTSSDDKESRVSSGTLESSEGACPWLMVVLSSSSGVSSSDGVVDAEVDGTAVERLL